MFFSGSCQCPFLNLAVLLHYIALLYMTVDVDWANKWWWWWWWYYTDVSICRHLKFWKKMTCLGPGAAADTASGRQPTDDDWRRHVPLNTVTYWPQSCREPTGSRDRRHARTSHPSLSTRARRKSFQGLPLHQSLSLLSIQLRLTANSSNNQIRFI